MEKQTLRLAALEALLSALLPSLDRIVLETAAVHIREAVEGADPGRQAAHLYALAIIAQALERERLDTPNFVLIEGGRLD